MVIRSDWRIGPSAVERAASSTTAAMSAAAETLQSHIEFVLDERVGALNDDQRRFLDVAVRYGDRLVRLVEDMRTVALTGSGELEESWSRFDLAACVLRAVEQVWPVAHVEGKRLGVQHEGPVWVDADEGRVARAVLGLLTDAVDAAPSGTAIAVSVEEAFVELAYEGEPPSELALALAEAIAALHGGDLTVRVADEAVAIGLRLEAPAAVTKAA